MTQMTSSQGDPTSSPVPLDLKALAAQARKLRDQTSAEGKAYGPRNGDQVGDWVVDVLRSAGYPAASIRSTGSAVYSAFSDAGTALFTAARTLDELVTVLDNVARMQRTGPRS